MIISRNWLQEYFKEKLPSAKEIAEDLTMHSFEIERLEEKDGDSILDVKVLPNRAHDCLCHRGIAKEVATLSDKKFSERGLSNGRDGETEEAESALQIKIDDHRLCPRYMGKRIENIETKSSPDWLREKLESVGERSINNVVDITNFVMLDMGQPMHAFDADKVEGGIHVRYAKDGEMITLLTGEEVALDESVLLIADEAGPLAIAGIKGGKKAEVTENTKNIILESANFNSTMVRKTSQKLGIKNNASKRYENEISPEMTETAMRQAAGLILENAQTESTKTYKTEDIYLRRRNAYKVGISLSEINLLLGTSLDAGEVQDILERTGWEWKKTVPKEEIAKMAEENKGKPYKYGASISFDAPDYFDCSSFTAYLFAQSGIAIPRVTVDQFVFGKEVKEAELMPGDLVFAQNDSDGEEKEVEIIATGEKIKQKVKHTKTFEFLPGTEVPEGLDHVGVYLGGGRVAHASGMWYKGEVVIEELQDSLAFKNIRGYRRVADLEEERFVVTTPPERLDLRIKEDLLEEIGRIYGYDKIGSAMPQSKIDPELNKNFEKIQQARIILTSLGYSEVYNYAFRNKGEVRAENPIASDKSFLRSNLKDGVTESLEMNYRNAPFLGLDEIKVFEIGTVFGKEKERIHVVWGVRNKKETKVEECSLEEGLKKLSALSPDYPKNIFGMIQGEGVRFKPISPYPFVLRDIAVWTPKSTEEKEALGIIVKNAGDILVRHKLFDKFEKEDRVSYAFNLVFQSQDRTMTDSEINEVMDKITKSLNSKEGWQVR